MVERRIGKWFKRGAAAILITAASYMPEVDIPQINLFNRADAAVGSLEPEPVLLITDHTRIHDQLYHERFNLEAVGPIDAITFQELVRLVGPKDSTVPKNLILWTIASKEGPAKVCAYTHQEPQTCQEIKDKEENISWYPFDTDSLKEPGDNMIVDSARYEPQGTGKLTIKIRITDEEGIGLLTSAKTTLILLDRKVYLPSIRSL